MKVELYKFPKKRLSIQKMDIFGRISHCLRHPC